MKLIVRKLWTWFGFFWLGLVLLELLSMSTLYLKRQILKQPADTRVNADAYVKDRSWANDYWKEFYALLYRWQPFVYWRLKETESANFKIDKNGLRHTWNPTNTSSQPITIYMFGGSALWGLGARDNYTIPSYLSKMFAHETGDQIRIVNYGQLAYVNTQELITLLLELEQHHDPDLAIFYDGINDITSSLLNKTSGKTLFESARAKEFNLLEKSRRKDLLKAFIQSNLDHSATAHVLSYFRWFHKYQDQKITSVVDTAGLADDLVSRYLFNLNIIQEIGKLRGFKTLFYWQPLLPTKRHKTPYEAQEIADLANTDFLAAVHNRIDQSKELNSNPDFHNLSHVFDEEAGPLYIDFCHLSENGNEKIARRMFPDIRKVIEMGDGY